MKTMKQSYLASVGIVAIAVSSFTCLDARADTLLFDNFNKGIVVQNSIPPNLTTFTLTQKTFITDLFIYAVNDQALTNKIGFVGIGLFDATKGTYKDNLYHWDAKPNIYLDPGTYTIKVQNPVWSYNDGSDNKGFAMVSGFAVPEPATAALFGAGLLGLGILRKRRQA
jgi:hypothetical protein